MNLGSLPAGGPVRLVDLDQVNDEVNRLPYVSDAARYDKPEFWKEIDASGGDCEDFAVGKLNRLHHRGWPIESLRLATCYVETGEYHAVLLAETERGAFMLDNRFPRPVPLSEVSGTFGYRPRMVQKTGGSREWVAWVTKH